ncbi:hypothetical protein Sste5346_010200 [Sporothrix stenoceras]|uniref:Uncharacterized protein n=1 Tax=Sporothrix stenoceras TaxID=5173 RepID=A0ABR3YGJ7_9PEZI
MRLHPLPWLLAQWIAPALVFGQTPQSIRDCPLPCNFVNGTSWLPYSRVSDLDWCNQTVLFQVMLHQPLDDPDIGSIVQACAASSSSSLSSVLDVLTGLTSGLTNDTASDKALFKRKSLNASAINNENSVTTFAAGATCMNHVETPTKAQRELQLLWSFSETGTSSKSVGDGMDNIRASAEHLAQFLSHDLSYMSSIMFAKINNVTMGVSL